MIRIEELKVGLLFWWTVYRPHVWWSGPCVVTYVDKDTLKVKFLDKFEEIGCFYLHDDRVRRTMRIYTIDELRKYLEEQQRKNAGMVVNVRMELERLKQAEIAYCTKAQEFLKEYS